MIAESIMVLAHADKKAAPPKGDAAFGVETTGLDGRFAPGGQIVSLPPVLSAGGRNMPQAYCI